jgi:hypothetical protein
LTPKPDAGTSLQTSVYVIYLKQAGLVGTTIGMLFAAAEIAIGDGFAADLCLTIPSPSKQRQIVQRAERAADRRSGES